MNKLRLKVFSMNNPNCEFVEMPTIDMFYDKPVIFNGSPIGFVPQSNNTFEIIGNEIIADVYIWDRYIDSNKSIVDLVFKNYCVSGEIIDKDRNLFKIVEIDWVEVEYESVNSNKI